MNSEFKYNYQQSQGMMNRIMEVEKKWEENKLAKLITMLDRIKYSQEHIQSDHLNTQVRSFFNVHLHRYIHQHEAQLEITQLIHYLLEVLDFNFDLKTISFFKVRHNREDTFSAILENWVEFIQASHPSQYNEMIINTDQEKIDQILGKDLIKLNKYSTNNNIKLKTHQAPILANKNLQHRGSVAIFQKQNSIKTLNVNQNIPNELIRQSTFKNPKQNLPQSESPKNKNDSGEPILQQLQDQHSTLPHHRQLFNRQARKNESKFFRALQQEKEDNKMKNVRNRNETQYNTTDNRIATDISNNAGNIQFQQTNQTQNSINDFGDEESDNTQGMHQSQIGGGMSQSQLRSHNASHFLHEDGSAVEEDIEFILNQQNVYKTLLLNEIISAHRLIETIRQDLQSVLDHVTNRTDFTSNLYIQDLLDCLLNNRVPTNWWKQGFLLSKKTLYDFIQSFLSKHEHLNLIINDRQGQLFPIIPMQKLFNPIQMFTSLQLQYCMQKNFKLHEVKFQLRKLRKMDSKQPSEGGIYVSGLFVKGGRLNMENYQLEDERPREFESTLPPLHVYLAMKSKVRQEVYFKEEFNYEPNIPFELIGGETVQGGPDKENEYFFFQTYPVKSYLHETKQNIQSMKVKPKNEEELRKQSLLSSEEQQKKLQEEINRVVNKDKQRFIDFEKASQYPVMNYNIRIPIVDSNTNSLFTQFPAKMYLYITSKKPQEYWIRKGTEIYIQKQF